MISSNTIQFLSELKENNNKSWFDANKSRYTTARQEVLSLVEHWIAEMSTIDASIAMLKPSQCIFRINRDVRFSKNKDPYKTNMGAFITPGGKNAGMAGYYLHIEPGQFFFGAGCYMPEPLVLMKIRQEIDYNFSTFTDILNEKKFKKYFLDIDRTITLQKPPKGFDVNNPAVEYLKLKSFTVFHTIEESKVMQDNFISTLMDISISSVPFIHFLNTAIRDKG